MSSSIYTSNNSNLRFVTCETIPDIMAPPDQGISWMVIKWDTWFIHVIDLSKFVSQFIFLKNAFNSIKYNYLKLCGIHCNCYSAITFLQSKPGLMFQKLFISDFSSLKVSIMYSFLTIIFLCFLVLPNPMSATTSTNFTRPLYSLIF